MMSMSHVWRARCDRAPAQFHVQAKILDDLLRQQADQIGIPRQARVVIRKNSLRYGRTADVIIFFQQQHAQPRAREICRRDEPVMSGSQNDDIVVRFHFELCRKRMLTSNIAKRTSNILGAFEYLSVLISIILALGMTRVLGGVGEMLQARSRHRIYWVHIIWIVNLFLYLVIAWWIFYRWRDQQPWNFYLFLFV